MDVILRMLVCLNNPEKIYCNFKSAVNYGT